MNGAWRGQGACAHIEKHTSAKADR